MQILFFFKTSIISDSNNKIINITFIFQTDSNIINDKEYFKMSYIKRFIIIIIKTNIIIINIKQYEQY